MFTQRPDSDIYEQVCLAGFARMSKEPQISTAYEAWNSRKISLQYDPRLLAIHSSRWRVKDSYTRVTVYRLPVRIRC